LKQSHDPVHGHYQHAQLQVRLLVHIHVCGVDYNST